MSIAACLKLARFHQPIGIILLWAPTAWALSIAYNGIPPVAVFLIFFLGTIVMRGAGCVINDIADRNIDLYVKRTLSRPLTSGQVNLKQALVTLGILLSIALILLLNLPFACFYYGLFALAITAIYPLCKRWIRAPQCILGVAFSMSIPMVFIAAGKPFDSTFLILYLINYLWIIAYDTQYAMVDRPDDLLIGVKSTAILFGSWDRIIIGLLQIVFHGLWLCLSFPLTPIFIIIWSLGLAVLFYQQFLIKQPTTTTYFKAFQSNAWYGLIMWIGLMV